MGRRPGSRNRLKSDNGAPAGIGHNTVSGDQLKSIVERIERLEAEKDDTAEQIREIYAESKSNGYDVKALRAIIRLRKQDASERAEHEFIVDTYAQALGMLSGTIFEDAARVNAGDTGETSL